MGFARFGNKLAGHLEKATRFGEKALGSVARFGDKVASGVKDIQKGVSNSAIIGKVADMPVYRGVSANQALGMIGTAASTGADLARQGQGVMKAGTNIIRTGRGIAEAGSISHAGAIADDMLRQGRSATQATKAIGQQIQRLR